MQVSPDFYGTFPDFYMTFKLFGISEQFTKSTLDVMPKVLFALMEGKNICQQIGEDIIITSSRARRTSELRLFHQLQACGLSDIP